MLQLALPLSTFPTLCTPESLGKLSGISQHTELCSNVHVAVYSIRHIFYDFHIYIRYLSSFWILSIYIFEKYCFL